MGIEEKFMQQKNRIGSAAISNVLRSTREVAGVGANAIKPATTLSLVTNLEDHLAEMDGLTRTLNYKLIGEGALVEGEPGPAIRNDVHGRLEAAVEITRDVVARLKGLSGMVG